MKKRLRKKLHVKEYAEYGMMVTVIPIPDGADQDIVMKVKAIADKHGIECWGGNNEFSLRPDHKKLSPPVVVTNLLRSIDEGQISGFTMFALIAPDSVTIKPEVEADLRHTFDDPSYPVYIAYPVDLWTGRNYTLIPHKIYHVKKKSYR